MSSLIDKRARTIMWAIASIKGVLCGISGLAAFYSIFAVLNPGFADYVRWEAIPWLIFFIVVTWFLGLSAVSFAYYAMNSKQWDKTPSITKNEINAVLKYPGLQIFLNIVYSLLIAFMLFLIWLNFLI